MVSLEREGVDYGISFSFTALIPRAKSVLRFS
jgi:hypothetical protein